MSGRHCVAMLMGLSGMALVSHAVAQAPPPPPSQTLGGQAAPAYPFVGRWNCEVANFTFTDKTYNNGSETLAIRQVTRSGKNEFRLRFDKNYIIVVQVVSARAMNWMSEASGDVFSCKRLS